MCECGGWVQDIVCELTPLQQRLYEVAMAGTSLDPGVVAASARGEAGQAAAPASAPVLFEQLLVEALALEGKL